MTYEQYKEMRDNPRIMGIVHNGRQAGVTQMLEQYAERYRLEQSLPNIKAGDHGSNTTSNKRFLI
jgi:hypothetical protein